MPAKKRRLTFQTLDSDIAKIKASKKKPTTAQIRTLFNKYNRLSKSRVYGEFVHPLRPKMKPIRAITHADSAKLKVLLRKLRALERSKKRKVSKK